MLIAEIYESIQGEGPWIETPSLFIRTSGCNLRCRFCDTPFTSWNPEGDQKSLEDLHEVVSRTAVEHVVITGGEPMLAPQLTELTEICRRSGKVITIETAGTVDRSVECDLAAISPKLANSTPDDPVWKKRHDETRFQPAVIRSLFDRYPAILKFVIDTPEDIEEVLQYIEPLDFIEGKAVWLMPQARRREELRLKVPFVKAAAEANGFRFSNRLHIEMHDNKRGV